MEQFALQPGMTPGLCPYGHTQCVPSVDAAESAQLIRKLQQELAEAKQQIRVRDELILELIKRPPEQSASPAKTNKKRKRAGQKEMKNRNRIIAAAAAEITLTYDRLPSVSEVMEKTALTQQQIYGSLFYQEGRIARASAITTEAMTGSSVQKTEFFGEKSEEHCRRRNRSKAEQEEIDVLADQQRADDTSPYVVT